MQFLRPKTSDNDFKKSIMLSEQATGVNRTGGNIFWLLKWTLANYKIVEKPKKIRWMNYKIKINLDLFFFKQVEIPFFKETNLNLFYFIWLKYKNKRKGTLLKNIQNTGRSIIFMAEGFLFHWNNPMYIIMKWDIAITMT